MANVLQETKAGRIFDWDDTEGICRYMDSLWDSFKAGDSLVMNADIEKYSRRMTTKKMVELFENIIGNVKE